MASDLSDLGAIAVYRNCGDAFDIALAESVNAAYKSELIRGPGQGPWRPSRTWNLPHSLVHWFNTERLHEYLGYVPPAEFEAACAAEKPDENCHAVK